MDSSPERVVKSFMKKGKKKIVLHFLVASIRVGRDPATAGLPRNDGSSNVYATLRMSQAANVAKDVSRVGRPTKTYFVRSSWWMRVKMESSISDNLRRSSGGQSVSQNVEKVRA